MAVKTCNGYTIAIHSQLPDALILRELEHELAHIYLGHLDECQDMPEEEKESQVIQLMQEHGWQ